MAGSTSAPGSIPSGGAERGDTASPPSRILMDEWGQNWRAGLASFLGVGLGGAIGPTIFSLFISPLQKDFGWSRSQIAFAFSASFISAILAPFYGRMIDKLGVRRPLLWGTAVYAAGWIGLSLMQGHLLVYYALFAMMTWASLLTTPLTYAKVVSRLFPGSRGLSLAIVRSGITLGSAGLPLLIFAAISTYGWRAGYLVMAILVTCFSLVSAYFWIDRKQGLASQAARPAAATMSWKSMVTDRRAVTLSLLTALGYAPSIAIQSQLQPLLTDHGLSAQMATVLLSIFGLVGIGGSLLSGYLVDRFWGPLIASIFVIGSGIGAVLLVASTPSSTILVIGVLMIGLSQGAQLTAYLVARYFGMALFASIYGMTIAVLAISFASWSMLIGYLYDLTGNYSLGMTVAAGSFLCAGAIYLTLGRYPDQAA